MSQPEILDETTAFPFGSQERAGYYARPAGDGTVPGIVIIHEIYGLNDNIKDIARRFAGEGYAALAVDLFAGRNRAVCMFRIMSAMLAQPLHNSQLNELKAALSFLAGKPEVDGNRVGAVGFCMGGTFAIAWACTDPRLRAIAPFYGMNPRPIGAVARMCPVVGSYPEKDFTAKPGENLDAELTKHNIPHDIKIYPGAQHSFFNDQGAHYDATASADAWQRILAFFGEHINNPDRGVG